MTPDEAVAAVERLSSQLDSRRPDIEAHLGYYRGDTGKLTFASEKFAEFFTQRYKNFSDNWCMPVAQAPAERITFLGVRPFGADRADENVQRAWVSNDADAGFSESALVTEITGRSFSLVHPASSPDEDPRLTWEHPSKAIVETHPVTGVDRLGMVTWRDGDDDFATLYTPDEVWRLVKRAVASDEDDERLIGWAVRSDIPETNPLGEVPLTELPTGGLLDDKPISGIAGVEAMQDAINLVWAYQLNALDLASLPGRVVLNSDVPEIPVLDKDGQDTGARRPVDLEKLIHEKILWIPGDNASIAEWTAANLEVFSGVIERAVEHVAAQTRTPPHYLVAKMVNTAAEALNVAEAGLVSKTRERITYMSRGMRKTARLIAKAQGAPDARIKALSAGKLLFADVQYRSEAQKADAMVKYRTIGFPFEWIAEQFGLEPDEVARVVAMREREVAADPLGAAQAFMQQG